MQALETIRANDSTLARIIERQGYCLTMEQVEQIQKINRSMKILVRCGNGRFLTPAQDVKWFTEIIEREGTDYVRDLSLPSDN